MSFSLVSLVEDCQHARASTNAPEAIAAVLRRAVADPAAIREAITQIDGGNSNPRSGHVLHCSEDLTILHVLASAHIYGVPHDHAGWSVIGVFGGAECFNQYSCNDGVYLIRQGYEVIRSGNVRILAADLIHDLENPSNAIAESLHVYSNQFFNIPARRIWKTPDAPAESFAIDSLLAWGAVATNARRAALGA